MTPREALQFACRLRTKLDDLGVEDRINSVIKRLGLQHCQNTLIGNWQIRGISGGERKRTSIGYELITEPSLLLLDEPTSGLDSLTALRIVHLMKHEC